MTRNQYKNVSGAENNDNFAAKATDALHEVALVSLVDGVIFQKFFYPNIALFLLSLCLMRTGRR